MEEDEESGAAGSFYLYTLVYEHRCIVYTIDGVESVCAEFTLNLRGYAFVLVDEEERFWIKGNEEVLFSPPKKYIV